MLGFNRTNFAARLFSAALQDVLVSIDLESTRFDVSSAAKRGEQIMVRCADKTGKSGLGHLPAEIYKFPQSGSTSHTDEEQGAQPANLYATEQRLYDELLALARKLDKRGAPGIYALVAAVADQVTLLKRKDQDTVAMLARGLDGLRQIDANHTSRRLQTMRQAMADQ